MDIIMIDGLRAYLSDKKNFLKYYRYLPSRQKNSDIYIVEFPKGGITWFSTIVANTNLILSQSRQRATYYNIQQLIPDIHMNRHVLDTPMWDTPRCRFIKSHFDYCPYYTHVIYLVRNPVSVMNSYYHYTQMLGQFKGTFEEFVKDPRFGIETWKHHVESWLLQGDSSQRIHLLRYEDLRSDPLATIRTLYQNLGIDAPDETIQEAVELASFENMQANEKLYKKHNPNTSLVFVREGKTKAVEIEEGVKQYILKECAHILPKLGYTEAL